jgi:hypothetical protein
VIAPWDGVFGKSGDDSMNRLALHFNDRVHQIESQAAAVEKARLRDLNLRNSLINRVNLILLIEEARCISLFQYCSNS